MLSAGLSQRRRDPYSEISRPPKEKKNGIGPVTLLISDSGLCLNAKMSLQTIKNANKLYKSRTSIQPSPLWNLF